MEYEKPHLTFERQVALLQERGIAVSDPAHAAAVLRRVGYYRFSAYTYPLRRLLPPETPRDSPVQFRAPEFVDDASFDLAESLWSFDRRLRLLMLDALECIEVALRVQVAFVLGERSTFAHLDMASLDAQRVAQVRDCRSDYQRWCESYRASLKKAEAEDFITHYKHKYDGKLPIWVATEILDFGMTVSLFGLMKQQDQTRVSRTFGVDSGRSFERWLKLLNYLRNVCAHHARLWNRTLTYGLAQIPPGLAVGLEHLAPITGRRRKKLYVAATVVAYLMRELDASGDWPERFTALIDSFPVSELVSPTRDMGFPDGWREYSPWRSRC